MARPVHNSDGQQPPPQRRAGDVPPVRPGEVFPRVNAMPSTSDEIETFLAPLKPFSKRLARTSKGFRKLLG